MPAHVDRLKPRSAPIQIELVTSLESPSQLVDETAGFSEVLRYTGVVVREASDLDASGLRGVEITRYLQPLNLVVGDERNERGRAELGNSVHASGATE